MKKYILTFTALLLTPSFLFAADAADTYKLAAPIPGAAGNTATNIIDYFGYLIPFLLSFAGVAALVIFIYGAIEYMASGGNPSRMSSGKEKITSVLAGLGLAIFATVILGTINPKLLRLKLDLVDVGQVNPTANKVTDECATPHCGGSCYDANGCSAGLVCVGITDSLNQGGRPVGYTCQQPASQCSENCAARGAGWGCGQDLNGQWTCVEAGSEDLERECSADEAARVTPPCTTKQVCWRVRRNVLGGRPSFGFTCVNQ